MASETHGRFVWYDLMTTDPEEAKAFYGAVVGWGTEPFEGPEGMPPYTMWTVDGQPMGGVMQLPEEAAAQGVPPHWLSYVSVDDVDGSTSQAEEAGASVLVDPQNIPAVGRFSVLRDPQGAVLAFFRPAEGAQGPLPEPGPGRFAWHELITSDADAAWDFYSALLGWEESDQVDLGDGWMYRLFEAGGHQAGGMFTKSDEMPGPPAWLYYVTVEDIEAALETVKEEGGKVLNGPMEVPGGDLVAQCMDPQGAAFALHAAGG